MRVQPPSMNSQANEERLQSLCSALVATQLSRGDFPVSCDSGAESLSECAASGRDLEATVKSLQSALVVLVQSMGPWERKAAMAPLLQLLRKAGDTDFISDAAAAAIAVCSGASASGDSGPPLYRIFTFSPSLHVHIQEMEFRQAELGWKVWGSALVLCKRLIGMQDHLLGKSVLELGSGCGLCGFLSAKLKADRVVLSDKNSHILRNLRSVVALLPEEELSRVQVRMLDWSEEPQEDTCLGREAAPLLGAEETFDFVIGSDVLYEETSLEPLVRQLSLRLACPNGQALIVTPIRKSYLLEHFRKGLGSAGLASEVADIDSQEWDGCYIAASEARNAVEFQDSLQTETFHGPGYYEGGCVAIYVSRCH